ncbi:hypothetical protein L1887_43386 [Cichorium endivia]|nr:hypothetical protein L1887_43386 [Cichorium endivia]
MPARQCAFAQNNRPPLPIPEVRPSTRSCTCQAWLQQRRRSRATSQKDEPRAFIHGPGTLTERLVQETARFPNLTRRLQLLPMWNADAGRKGHIWYCRRIYMTIRAFMDDRG